MTIIYFVRHAESPFIEGKERSRALSVQGSLAAERVKEMLLNEGIDAILSSPYQRAKDTVQPLADALGLPIAEQEDLRERMAGDFLGHSFLDAKRNCSRIRPTPSRKSGKAAQSRALRAFEEILNTYGGKRVAIGTHGDIMTLMLQHYDERFDYHFWLGTTLPDIYRAEFEEGRLVNLARLWSEHQEEG